MNDHEPLPAILMSLSCISDCDLLCGEENSGVDSTEYSSDLDSSSPPSLSLFAEEEEEESIAVFIEHEHNFVTGFDYFARFQSHSLVANAREESIAWILKVKKFNNTITLCFIHITLMPLFHSLNCFNVNTKLPRVRVSITVFP
jgi:cyclin D1/2/4